MNTPVQLVTEHLHETTLYVSRLDDKSLKISLNSGIAVQDRAGHAEEYNPTT